MLPVTILTVGRLKDRFFEDASTEYMKYLKQFAKTEIVEIPAATLPDNPAQSQIQSALDKEAELLLKRIPDSAFVAALCIEGKQYSSEDMAEMLKTNQQTGKPVFFIIGGSYGLAETVKKRANVRLSMSRMTFPHRLARIMLLEQIYRGFTINAGKTYHK
ncbi:MAG: 23S rRNA (pseudouridine(1915)-N(3))-methyltransferase RlmH [Clostridia bacterium]|nr:23S rRNA (pseudouridine(1915)-N(3))-methyltransferase RlmH [Clostridia bacterium]